MGQVAACAQSCAVVDLVDACGTERGHGVPAGLAEEDLDSDLGAGRGHGRPEPSAAPGGHGEARAPARARRVGLRPAAAAGAARAGPVGAWASSAGASSEPPADLSGLWALRSVEGDFEALMIDAGVSWALRGVARSLDYGAGLVTHSIEQQGNWLAIEFDNGPGQATGIMKLAVGGGCQSTHNEDGAPIVVDPRWEGRCLVVAGRAADGSTLPPSRRFVSGQEMVCESTTSTGEVVMRIFARCP